MRACARPGCRRDERDPETGGNSGRLAERNAGLPPERRIEFRVGDVVEEADGDLMGDGVNIAAALSPARAHFRFACAD